LINHGWRALRRRLGWTGGNLYTHAISVAFTFVLVAAALVIFRAADIGTAGRMLGAMLGMTGIDQPDGLALQLVSLAALAVIVFFAPNTQEWMADYQPALVERPLRAVRLRWRPTRRWAVAMALIAVWSLLGINQYSEFLYFQF
jgi:alginate O-acetyltransferase complex protein AlgI